MTLDPAHILLAEDDPADVELALSAMQCGDAGRRIEVVHTGEDALDYLHRRRAWKGRGASQPALVLLDLKMPGIGGLEALRAIKSDARTRCIPVVVFTSSGERRDVSLCYESGANAYVVKPVEFPCFVETLQAIGHFWTGLNTPPARSLRLRR
ncbi:MAG: response regulator [Spartobacteria bacterium]